MFDKRTVDYIEEAEWLDEAQCAKEKAAELFFSPASRESRQDRLVREEAAKLVCQRCVVIKNCLDYALSTKEKYGVWGGMTAEERLNMIKEQEQEKAS